MKDLDTYHARDVLGDEGARAAETNLENLDTARDDLLAARGLPELAWLDNAEGQVVAGGAKVLVIRRGEHGYCPTSSILTADQLNRRYGVTEAQVQAMLCGSMFGWHCPAAFPATHGLR